MLTKSCCKLSRTTLKTIVTTFQPRQRRLSVGKFVCEFSKAANKELLSGSYPSFDYSRPKIETVKRQTLDGREILATDIEGPGDQSGSLLCRYRSAAIPLQAPQPVLLVLPLVELI